MIVKIIETFKFRIFLSALRCCRYIDHPEQWNYQQVNLDYWSSRHNATAEKPLAWLSCGCYFTQSPAKYSCRHILVAAALPAGRGPDSRKTHQTDNRQRRAPNAKISSDGLSSQATSIRCQQTGAKHRCFCGPRLYPTIFDRPFNCCVDQHFLPMKIRFLKFFNLHW